MNIYCNNRLLTLLKFQFTFAISDFVQTVFATHKHHCFMAYLLKDRPTGNSL